MARSAGRVFVTRNLLAGMVISLALAPGIVAAASAGDTSDPKPAIQCANPPNSAEFEELLPCIEGRKVWVTLRSGKSFSGKLKLASGAVCAVGKACELTLSTRFRRRTASVADLVSVRYRAPSSARRRALGWAVGIGVAFGASRILFWEEDQAFALSGDDSGYGYLGAIMFAPIGAGAGVLAGRGRMVTVQMVEGSTAASEMSPTDDGNHH